MKKLLIVVAILAIFFIGAPLIIGSSAEKHVRGMYEQMNQHPAVEVSVAEYQSGWFTSKAKINLVVSSANSAPIPPITIHQTLFHGPLLWEVGGLGFGISDSTFNLELPEEAQKELDELKIFEEDTFKAQLRIFFNGSMKSTFAMKAFNFKEKDVDISVNAAEFNGSASSDGEVESSGYWNGMVVKEKDQTVFNMGTMQLTGKQKIPNGEVFSPYAMGDGDFEITVDSFEIQPQNPMESVTVETLKITANSKLNGELMNGGAVFSAKTVKAIQQTFTDFVYDISLENLHVETMKLMNEQMSSPAAQANPMAAMAQVQGLLPKLVEHNPILKVNNIGVNTEKGEIKTAMEVRLNQDLYDVNNPMTMMLALNAIANGEGPEEFFTNLGMGGQIEQMVQQNFLVRSAGKIKFDFSFQQGQALLNGNPIPLM